MEKLNDQKPIIVSLFGEPTVATVHEAVLAEAVSPGKRFAGQAVDVARQTADAMMKIADPSGTLAKVWTVAGGASSSFALRLLRVAIDSDRLIVFDDFERSTIPPRELLGLINDYVERHGCRVVVIANEEKLSSEVGPMREKLFGQTLTVQPDVDGAFDEFFRSGDPKRLLSDSLRGIIRDVFVHSTIPTLRVARQLVHDVVRLLGVLSEQQREKADVIGEVVGTFAAWSVEVRARRLERHHVDRRSSAAVARALMRTERGQADPEESDWEALQNASYRYRALGIALIDCPWPGDLLERMLFDGEFCANEIQRSLDLTHWYQTAASLDAWRVLWWWESFTDEELKEAARRLVEQIESRDQTETFGDLRHRCARLLQAADWQLVEMSTDQALTQCKAYVEDVVPALLQMNGESDDDSLGVGFLAPDSAVRNEFTSVLKHLQATIDSVNEGRLPQLAEALLTGLTTEGEGAVATKLNAPPRSANGRILPFLHHLDPDRFVAQLLTRPYREQLAVGFALAKYRDQLKRESSDVAEPDLRWVEESVAAALVRAADAGSVAAPFRLRLLARRLTPAGSE